MKLCYNLSINLKIKMISLKNKHQQIQEFNNQSQFHKKLKKSASNIMSYSKNYWNSKVNWKKYMIKDSKIYKNQLKLCNFNVIICIQLHSFYLKI